MDEALDTHGQEVASVSERNLEGALVAFHRSISAAQIYPPNHPMLRDALNDGFGAWKCAEENARWESPGLQLRAGVLWLGDAQIGHGSPAVSSLVRTLQSRGLVSIRRTAPLSLHGYAHLVTLLTTAPDILARQGGIVEAWKAERYASALEIRGLAVSTEAPSAEEGSARARGTEWGEGLPSAEEISVLADPLLQARLQSFQQRGPEERRVLDLLLRLGRTEDLASFLELLREIGRIVDGYLQSERYREAFHVVLYLYREAQNMDALGKAAKRDALLDSVRLTVRGGFLPWLIAQVASTRGGEEAEVGEYILRFLGEAAVVPIINALVGERNRGGRRRLVDVLVAIGEPAVPWALKMLEDQRWFVVRNMATVLGGIGSPEGFKAILRLSRDPDGRIRKEVARLIGKPSRVGAPDAEDCLIELLEDTDSAVRRAAISSAAQSRSPRVLEALWSAFRRTRIWSKAWEVKLLLLKAIGQMGLAEAVPRMAAVAKGRPLLWRRRWQTVQSAVAQALGDLGAPGAEALAELQRHSDPKACQAEASAVPVQAESGSEEET